MVMHILSAFFCLELVSKPFYQPFWKIESWGHMATRRWEYHFHARCVFAFDPLSSLFQLYKTLLVKFRKYSSTTASTSKNNSFLLGLHTLLALPWIMSHLVFCELVNLIDLLNPLALCVRLHGSYEDVHKWILSSDKLHCRKNQFGMYIVNIGDNCSNMGNYMWMSVWYGHLGWVLLFRYCLSLEPVESMGNWRLRTFLVNMTSLWSLLTQMVSALI